MKGQKKVLAVFGTRPEAIKMAPLVLELAARPEMDCQVAVTAQHREMLDQVLQLFQISPAYDLNLMRHGQTIGQITAGVLKGLDEVLADAQPDVVLVHGDTTTTFAASLAAFYRRIPCGHVEAGLRTFDKYAPYPEEINRRLTGVLADYHFAPTAQARDNLLAEGVPPARIAVTGNTVIDALLQVVKKDCSLTGLGLDAVDWRRRVLLLTCHRRENWGAPMEEIFGAVRQLVAEQEEVEVVFPVHKNPVVREVAQQVLGDCPRVHLCEPLDYLPLCHVMNRCYLVLTDSGGLQEEAPALGKPVLVLRQVTERPEAVAAGTARLVGTDRETILAAVGQLLRDPQQYQGMARAVNPFGDGTASRQIGDHLAHWLDEAGR